MLHAQLRLGVTVTAGLGCTATMLWAQKGRIPWVESLGTPLGPKGVMKGVQICAELLPFSCVFNVRDWM